jgi:hypothetical protein
VDALSAIEERGRQIKTSAYVGTSENCLEDFRRTRRRILGGEEEDGQAISKIPLHGFASEYGMSALRKKPDDFSEKNVKVIGEVDLRRSW